MIMNNVILYRDSVVRCCLVYAISSDTYCYMYIVYVIFGNMLLHCMSDQNDMI